MFLGDLYLTLKKITGINSQCFFSAAKYFKNLREEVEMAKFVYTKMQMN